MLRTVKLSSQRPIHVDEYYKETSLRIILSLTPLTDRYNEPVNLLIKICSI